MESETDGQKTVSFPHEAIQGSDSFSAQVDAFPYHEWPKATSDSEMHQRVLRKSQTRELPHVEKAFSNVAINKLVNLKITWKLKNSWNRSVQNHKWQGENLWMAVAFSIFMPRPPAQLEVPMNLDAISKNVKILQFGPVEPKLWNFCEKLVKSPWGRKNPFPNGPLINQWGRKS